MRRKIVAGNWKMNLTNLEAVRLADQVNLSLTAPLCDVVLFPSFLYLNDILNHYDDRFIEIGAQNCSQYENGAYTGEISASQLASIGAKYVLIGHSERRGLFGETNAVINEKVKLVLKNKLVPVFCCGEPSEIRMANKQGEYVLNQLEETVFDLTEDGLSKLIIAYEPVWAIGTGLNATAEQAQEMHLFIRQKIAAKYSDALADKMRILYGGSCNPGNAAELFACADVDGGLIGGASLKAKDFLAIIELAK